MCLMQFISRMNARLLVCLSVCHHNPQIPVTMDTQSALWYTIYLQLHNQSRRCRRRRGPHKQNMLIHPHSTFRPVSHPTMSSSAGAVAAETGPGMRISPFGACLCMYKTFWVHNLVMQQY